ncbi:hypothetical protein [Sphingomonas phyllosphaerae]|uniref:hypothetical protein n=1 Tax=Sphingomonas phyllosphaerae TaxID=257003 RepID=UPI002413A4BE|nr:hypothetical protein [Sphingomonas phyllosphaerae]
MARYIPSRARLAPLTAALVLAAGCVPQVTPPPPAPTPAPAPVPVPSAPAPAPLAADWQDWQRTPGTWRYAREAAGTVASFGTGATAVATARCDRAARAVTLTRIGGVAAPFTVRTSATTRTLPTTAVAGGAAVSLAASDRLLDAMVFSRGRFTLEQPGSAPLVLPPWAELARVIEDCRG